MPLHHFIYILKGTCVVLSFALTLMLPRVLTFLATICLHCTSLMSLTTWALWCTCYHCVSITLPSCHYLSTVMHLLPLCFHYTSLLSLPEHFDALATVVLPLYLLSSKYAPLYLAWIILYNHRSVGKVVSLLQYYCCTSMIFSAGL